MLWYNDVECTLLQRNNATVAGYRARNAEAEAARAATTSVAATQVHIGLSMWLLRIHSLVNSGLVHLHRLGLALLLELHALGGLRLVA